MVSSQVEEVCADGVHAVVVEVQCGQFVECSVRAVDHGDGDDAVEGDHRSGRDAAEQLVQREDLRPVGVFGGPGLGGFGGSFFGWPEAVASSQAITAARGGTPTTRT